MLTHKAMPTLLVTAGGLARADKNKTMTFE